MITLTQQGTYSIAGTKDHKTMLTLDDVQYLRSYAPKIGDLLTFAKHEHTVDHLIVDGKYRIYKVKGEPNLVDLEHLELSVGRGKWQGYLLLTGLPTARKIRSRIVTTDEVITSKRASKKVTER
jgi:hypothetical protein